jgi:IS5 family transposase
MKIEGRAQMTFGIYDLDQIVKKDHPLRKIREVIDFGRLAHFIKDCASERGRSGYGLDVALKCLFLQFYYDLSDREMEEEVRDRTSFRWFLDFDISEVTPDHSYFCRMRKQIGTSRIGDIFRLINTKAKISGMVGGVFHFVDSTTIKTKETTWEERDKAKKEGEEKLNNENIEKYSADPDARFGCKGKSKFWFGYKRHAAVDMRQGLITKVAVTAANLPDADGLEYICPTGGMIFADKAYGISTAQNTLKEHGCHSGAILKNNMKNKDFDKDRWLTRVRMPFENIFSKDERRARYRGLARVQLQAFLEAIVHNVKRLVTVGAMLSWAV